MQSHSTGHCPETVENAQVGLGVGLGVGLLSVRCGVGDGVRCQPSGLCAAILHSCACSSAPQSTPRPRDCFQRWRLGPSCSQTRHNRRIALLSRSRLPYTMSDWWKSPLRTAADRRRSTACCEAPSLAAVASNHTQLHAIMASFASTLTKKSLSKRGSATKMCWMMKTMDAIAGIARKELARVALLQTLGEDGVI